jgi:hypothetical protein
MVYDNVFFKLWTWLDGNWLALISLPSLRYLSLSFDNMQQKALYLRSTVFLFEEW